MNVICKDAAITNTGTDEDFPGSFEVILSTPAEDRDGDNLLTEDWELPLPSHITFDQDHEMTVAGTVGSGVPAINEKGQLVVAGTYSSLGRAQDVRTLVKEGHIRTTSVAFMTKSVTKGGKQAKVRELLNGAFVAIPSNREALVTAAKSVKAGARHSAADAQHVQAIHDHALALGAKPAGPDDSSDAAAGTVGGKALRRMVAAKAVDGSYEQRQQAIGDALDAEYRDTTGDRYVYAYPLATFEDSVVFRVSGGDTDTSGQWQASYTYNDDGTVTLGEAVRVNMVEQVVPVGKAYTATDGDDEPGKLAQGVDAALDEASRLLAGIDLTTLPEEVQQAVGLLTAAEETVDELLEALGVTDPDDDAPAAADNATAATEAAVAKSAAAEAELALQGQAIAARASAWAAS